MLQSFVLLFAAVIIFAVGVYLLLRSRQFNSAGTKLKRTISPKTGRVRRVYVKRNGLKAKLWFQRTTSGFQIRHFGSNADFSVSGHPGEPIHVAEARQALEDLGLDINCCSWDDIVAKSVL